MHLPTLLGRLREVAASRLAHSLEWRLETLRALRRLIEEHEPSLLDALAADVGKPRPEAWMTEVGFVLADLDHTLLHLPGWMAPERVATPVTFKPGTSSIHRQPLGVVAVIAPWNYPVQLSIAPVVAALAAGNAVVLKPSELAPRTSAALAALFAELDSPAVAVVEGGVAATTELLAERFDHILYTGNGRVARIVMRAAAEHLTPVTLELGGKSPAIVSARANLDVAARRIAWGKFVNSGQTCIAPDHVLVERSVHDRLVAALGEQITVFYGDDPQASESYARIVNDAHFDRLVGLLDGAHIAHGGEHDRAARYLAPTVVVDVDREGALMGEEIFGPILPVLAVDSLDEAIALVNDGATSGVKPLALYSFSEDEGENERILAGTSSGGACVNGTLMHVSNPNLPFGGVGESGMGAYHGRAGFETFSHRRAVMERTTKLDPPMTYPPYTAGRVKLIRRALRIGDPRDLLTRLRNLFRRG